MNRTIKLMIAIFGLLLIIAMGLYMWHFQDKGNERLEPHVNEYVVNFEERNSKIYISAKTWGLAGNERITVSLYPFESTKDYLENKCLIFYTSQLYYKKQGVDTLLLYVAASGVPKKSKNLTSSIKIVQVELTNSDEIRDYEVNYKKNGLSKASIYKR